MSLPTLRKIALRLAPWIATLVAVHYAFSGIDWQLISLHLGECDPYRLTFAVFLTFCSYLLRSRRWQFLFPNISLNFFSSMRVLWLGFFMNNVLPARAGELVRAHMGSRLSGCKRTLVLATIASERLVDGLTLSLFFICFSLHSSQQQLSPRMLIVVYLFALVALGVVLVLSLRSKLEQIARAITTRYSFHSLRYLVEKLHTFLDGLAPLSSIRTLVIVGSWSLLVWSVELAVYQQVAAAFGANLSLNQAVIFLVAVNFSSLIPSAPGGIGVIEAVASAVLVSIGIAREQALTMVLVQHTIQYLVIGLPGIIFLLTWKKYLKDSHLKDNEQQQTV